jgi:sporulation protein YlmC with PRC-barrel domain
MTTPPFLRTMDDPNAAVADMGVDVRGYKALDLSGAEIGTVESLLVDYEEGRVRFLSIASGGIFGIGEKHFLVPVGAINNITEDAVVIAKSSEHVAGSPMYDPTIVGARDDYERYYTHYGLAPFWGAS